jgi:hypothetical protein
MPSTQHYVAATAILAGSASAFVAPAPLGLSARRLGRAPATGLHSTKMEKPGTANNRMTETKFDVPLVEKREFPGTIHGYQWVVKDDLLVESKLNSYEKAKKAKAGLAVMDTLEELAAQAKAKGGAQYLDEEDINIRLKWLGLFHRLKYVPGTFMQRFKCPNGSFTLKQWRAINDQVREYDDGSRDFWKANGCYSLTTRQNVQLFGLRLENVPRHFKALKEVGVHSIQVCCINTLFDQALNTKLNT